MTGKDSDRAFENAHTGRAISQGNWQLELRTKLVEVLFFDAKGETFTEKHVDDSTTLPETARMTMERLVLSYAVFPYLGRWCLVTPGKSPTKLFRYYDTREAAEMVAIHRG